MSSNRYLVISYDLDEQRTYFDKIIARDSEEAREIIGDIRIYAIPIIALNVSDLLSLHNQLRGIGELELSKEIEDLREAHRPR